MTSFPDSRTRCNWCSQDEIYIQYHDHEWGVLVKEDKKLFEFLTLEGAQAGLNWLTILKRRKNYQCAFEDFDFIKVAGYGEKKIEELINNKGLIRNRAKILSSISNAKSFIKIIDEFGGFFSYTMRFFPQGQPIQNYWDQFQDIPVETPESIAMSKDMKKRGFSFFGPVICYAHLQATGAIWDHLNSCFLAKKP
jgi:DNA-3-methyladenine glycosylase I